MTKKLLLFISIISFFTATAQIPGVVNYSSTGSAWHTGGDHVEVQFYSCHGNSIIIEFVNDDNYVLLNNNGEWFTSYNNKTLEIFSNGPGGIGMSDSLIVEGQSQGRMISFSIYKQPQELDSINFSLSDNRIVGDSIKICSEYGTDGFNMNLYFDWGNQDYEKWYGSNNYGNNNFLYVNDTLRYETQIPYLNLKNGDEIQFIIEPYQYLYGQSGCEYTTIYDTLKSKKYIVSLEENPRLSIVDTILPFQKICPKKSIQLAKSASIIANKYYWRKGPNYNYFSAKDTVTISTPMTIKLVENNTQTCPIISQDILIEADTNCQGYISGTVMNQDDYTKLAGIKVVTNTGLTTTSDSLGFYEFYFDGNNAPSYVQIAQPDYFADKEYVYFSSNDFKIDDYEHLYTYLIQQKDIAIFINSGRNRPGFTIPQYVSIESRGKDSLITDVCVTLDGNLTYVSETGENQPFSVVGNKLTWKNITVKSGETIRLKYFATLDRFTQLGTILKNTGVLIQTTPDDVVKNDTNCYQPEVTGAYDPNDKQATYDGAANNGYIHDTTGFEYTIRFQNTGTDTAFNITVADKITSYLDISSIDMVDASHSYAMTIRNDSVFWVFSNILLVDSNMNEPLSHGYIRFKIQQKDTNAQGTQIKNKAFIYFDFNEAIITNEHTVEVNNNLVTSIAENPLYSELINTKAYPNPANDFVSFEGINSGTMEVYNSIGKQVYIGQHQGSLNIKDFSKGLYLVKINDGRLNYTATFIKK